MTVPSRRAWAFYARQESVSISAQRSKDYTDVSTQHWHFSAHRQTRIPWHVVPSPTQLEQEVLALENSIQSARDELKWLKSDRNPYPDPGEIRLLEKQLDTSLRDFEALRLRQLTERRQREH